MIHAAHVGTTRGIIWRIDHIIKIHARITLGVYTSKVFDVDVLMVV
jgi:hypothetical protein